MQGLTVSLFLRNWYAKNRFNLSIPICTLEITMDVKDSRWQCWEENTYLKIWFKFNNSVKSYQIGISWMNFVVDFCDLWSEVELNFQFGSFFRAKF